MTPRWKLHRNQPAPAAAELCRRFGLHPIVAAILERRGADSPDRAARFLKPSLSELHDPYLLRGMPEAVGRVAQALRTGQRIVISGDYDVDGITSSALLGHFLRDAGAERVQIFIPNRFEHGYGLTPRTVEALLALRPELVITVDNGITAVAEVARLQAAGISTVITDHHLPREAGVPAGIVVNPQQPGCPYPFKKISGCGVTFKLVTALRKHLREVGWWSAARPEPNLKALLDLVAVGTVADVMPLQEENRALLVHGLEVMNQGALRPGLSALLAYGKPEPVTARTLAFRVAPRINAAGRMSDGSLAVRLLLATDPAEAAELASRLEAENTARRARGEEMQAEAVAAVREAGLDGAAGIVVHSPQFHEGIIGITAARMVELFHRPVVVCAENGDGLKGSARSVPGVNVTAAFDACAGLLTQYGGHAGAAGCTLPKANLETFRRRFAEACAALGGAAEPPFVLLEGRLEPGMLSEELVTQLLSLEPFGHGNEEPCFLVEQRGLPPAQAFGNGHLRWNIDPRTEMVAWNASDKLNASGDTCYRVRLGFNEFRGQRKVRLLVEDWQHSRPEEITPAASAAPPAADLRPATGSPA